MYHFTRTEAGVTVHTDSRSALAEINHAIGAGKRDVRAMSAGSGRYAIEHEDGRLVLFVRVVGDVPASEPTVNVVGVNGGRVHAKSGYTTHDHGECRVYALCRVSARTVYRETSAPLTCDVCVENERRKGL
jgi:hypothetical protein